jgi:hypothetical protein
MAIFRNYMAIFGNYKKNMLNVEPRLNEQDDNDLNHVVTLELW